MLLEHLVIHQHAAGLLLLLLLMLMLLMLQLMLLMLLMLMLLMLSQLWRYAGSLVEVVDVMPLMEALNGSALLCLVPGSSILYSSPSN